jgi:hypothetical protein
MPRQSVSKQNPVGKMERFLKNSQSSHPAMPVATISLFRDQDV